MMELHRCRKCGEDKPSEGFYTKLKYPYSRCRACYKEYNALKYRKKHIGRVSGGHRLSNIDPGKRTANCSLCGLVSVKFKPHRRRWVCGKNPQYSSGRGAGYRSGKCPICGEETTKLVLDHNHKSDRDRGWICTNCNTGIGFLKDAPATLRRAADYLDGSP